jgi:DNA-binding transcriptional MerR regulator
VIWLWERRFKTLTPTRVTNRYRNYSDEDVALLSFLKQLLDAGTSIGELSQLGQGELLSPTPGIGGEALARRSSGCGDRALQHEEHSPKDFLGHESGYLSISQSWITGWIHS